MKIVVMLCVLCSSLVLGSDSLSQSAVEHLRAHGWEDMTVRKISGEWYVEVEDVFSKKLYLCTERSWYVGFLDGSKYWCKMDYTRKPTEWMDRSGIVHYDYLGRSFKKVDLGIKTRSPYEYYFE